MDDLLKLVTGAVIISILGITLVAIITIVDNNWSDGVILEPRYRDFDPICATNLEKGVWGFDGYTIVMTDEEYQQYCEVE